MQTESPVNEVVSDDFVRQPDAAQCRAGQLYKGKLMLITTLLRAISPASQASGCIPEGAGMFMYCILSFRSSLLEGLPDETGGCLSI